MKTEAGQQAGKPAGVKERPILFSGEMVRALLDGRKTQTRRVVDVERTRAQPVNRWHHLQSICPYGQPGDRLWVKETFRPFRHPRTSLVGLEYTDGHMKLHRLEAGQVFKFSEDDEVLEKKNPARWIHCKRKPAIFMPRWASRLTLEIVRVRVERVQDISEEDAMAEGCALLHGWLDHREAYRLLWDSLNAKRGFGWDKNPWVWVLEFRLLSAPPRLRGESHTLPPDRMAETDTAYLRDGEASGLPTISATAAKLSAESREVAKEAKG